MISSIERACSQKFLKMSISLLIFFLNKEAYRFRAAENGYPIYQLGPGFLSVHTIDEKYEWDKYEKTIQRVVDALFCQLYI